MDIAPEPYPLFRAYKKIFDVSGLGGYVLGDKLHTPCYGSVAMGYKVYAGPTNVNVVWTGDTWEERGTAEASRLTGDTGHWHICRVLVQPASNRGRGIGGDLLDLLKEEVRERGGETLTVDPGGYDNNQERQRYFYQKCGFEPLNEYRMVCHLVTSKMDSE